MKKPAWKAENARIRKEMAARKDTRIVQVVKDMPWKSARLEPLKASFKFSEWAAQRLPEDSKAFVANYVIKQKITEKIGGSIKMERKKGPEGEDVWLGTLEIMYKEEVAK